MASIMDENTYNQLMADFNHAKEFKSDSILFTPGHIIIGLGEQGSYFRVENNLIDHTYLSNIVIENKEIMRLMKLPREELSLEEMYKGSPLITVGLSPRFMTEVICSVIDYCSPSRLVYEEDITHSDTIKELKKIKAAEGLIFHKIPGYIVPLNKRFLPILASDKVILRVFDFDDFCYVCLETINRKHQVFDTYIRILKV